MNVLLRRKESFWLLGFSTCLSLLVEEKVSIPIPTVLMYSVDIEQKRRAELGKLSLYVEAIKLTISHVRPSTSAGIRLVLCEEAGVSAYCPIWRDYPRCRSYGDGHGCVQGTSSYIAASTSSTLTISINQPRCLVLYADCYSSL